MHDSYTTTLKTLLDLQPGITPANRVRPRLPEYGAVAELSARRKAQGERSLVAELEHMPAELVHADPAALDRRESFLIAARPYLPLLKMIDFVPITSGDLNDPPQLKPWVEGHQRRIDEFRKDFPDSPASGDRPIAFLIVKSMLLTGFDAPIEQVIYLDRPIKEAELLQAIARTNRTRPGKQRGLVVDYFGVANHLEEALAAYDADDAADTLGALRSVADEIDTLRPKRNRLWMIFTDHGVTPRPRPKPDRPNDCDPGKASDTSVVTIGSSSSTTARRPYVSSVGATATT
jgi:hypothetical protein